MSAFKRSPNRTRRAYLRRRSRWLRRLRKAQADRPWWREPIQVAGRRTPSGHSWVPYDADDQYTVYRIGEALQAGNLETVQRLA